MCFTKIQITSFEADVHHPFMNHSLRTLFRIQIEKSLSYKYVPPEVMALTEELFRKY
jgi:hypothetical protein